jgi:hypothetical protein
MIEGTTGGGTIGPTIDARNGTYAALYVASKSGVTDTIVALIDGTPVWRRTTVMVSP